MYITVRFQYLTALGNHEYALTPANLRLMSRESCGQWNDTYLDVSTIEPSTSMVLYRRSKRRSPFRTNSCKWLNT
jgi:hypothetical protein